MRSGILYKLTFKNGKSYIGITRESLDQRIRRHVQYARAGRKLALSCAIRKHGEDSFSSEIIATGVWSELKRLEIESIKIHRASGITLYNMTDGGDGSLGVSLSKETRAKISQSLRGRSCSEIHCKRVSDAQKGKKISNETKQKMRISAMKRALKPMSEDQKQKIRTALIGKKQTPERIAKRVAARIANGSY